MKKNMAQNENVEIDRYLRLLLDPDDYAAMLGVSIKDHFFGPQLPGPEGNQALRRAYDRARLSGGMTEKAFNKLCDFSLEHHQLGIPDPANVPPDVVAMGPWGFAESTIRQFAPETVALLRDVVGASNNLHSVARRDGVQAFAAELRRVPSSASGAVLYHNCADRVLGSNTGDSESAMAPLHIYVATLLLLAFLFETMPNKNDALVMMKRLVLGSSDREGPRLALGRWMDTARNRLGYRTKTEFYQSLSNQLDERLHPEYAENIRIEWSKVANGRVCPPLPKMRQALERSVEKSHVGEVGCDLHERLDLGLCYVSFITRSHQYLVKGGVSDPDRVFDLALSEVLKAVE